MVLLAKCPWHTQTERPCSLAHSRHLVKFCWINYLWSLSEPYHNLTPLEWWHPELNKPVCAGKGPFRRAPISNGATTRFENHSCLFLDGHTYHSTAKTCISLTFSCICPQAWPSPFSPSVQFAFPTSVEKLLLAYFYSHFQFIKAFVLWSFLPWCWCHCLEVWATLCPSVWASD